MKLNYFCWPNPTPDQSTAQQMHSLPLVFLHGLGGTGQIWRPIVASLENEWNCIAPDQRGHGKSRPLPEDQKNSLNALDFAKDIKELLEELKINRCILIGHSMGVRTALALTTLIPEKIAGVMALDLGMSSQWGGGMGIALSQFIKNLPVSFPNRESLKEYLNKNCPDPGIAQYLAAVAKKVGPTFLANHTATSDLTEWRFPFEHDALVKTIEHAHQTPIKDWVLKAQENKIPILFLHGRTSRVWSVADYEAQRASLESPLLQFESWENTGHGLPFEQRLRFIERVKSFANPLR